MDDYNFREQSLGLENNSDLAPIVNAANSAEKEVDHEKDIKEAMNELKTSSH